jgi:hypothetical protein
MIPPCQRRHPEEQQPARQSGAIRGHADKNVESSREMLHRSFAQSPNDSMEGNLDLTSGDLMVSKKLPSAGVECN